MPKIKYHVRLSKTERRYLLDLVSKGTAPAKEIMHANVLLAADENNNKTSRNEAAIAKTFHINQQTVHTIRRRYSESGLDAAIKRKKRETPPVEPKITGEVEAHIIALSCSTPPEGHS